MADARVVVGFVTKPYWRALPADERDRIVAAVPDGHRLHLYPGHRSTPGVATVELRTIDNRSAGEPVRGRVSVSLCWAALRPVAAVS